MNLNNKYPKIIKHLLDKFKGVLDARSIFRLKGSNHSQFFYEMATLIISTESTGKCATWSLFFKTDLHGCCFTEEIIPPDDCARLYYYERPRLHFKNCFSWGVNLFVLKYFNVHFALLRKSSNVQMENFQMLFPKQAKRDFNNILFSLKKKTLSLHCMTMFALFVPKQWNCLF